MVSRCYGGFEAIDAQPLDKPAEVKNNRGRQPANGKMDAPKTFASKIFDHHQFGSRNGRELKRQKQACQKCAQHRICPIRIKVSIHPNINI